MYRLTCRFSTKAGIRLVQILGVFFRVSFDQGELVLTANMVLASFSLGELATL